MCGHLAGSGAWRHGYWTDQEAHHGTEHFDVFLRALWRLDPDDAETARQFTDAAEHVGNWADGVPEWFDPETGLFRSMYLGTDAVWTGPGYDLNVPDHLRLVSMALLAHEMTDDFRYLDLAGPLVCSRLEEAPLHRGEGDRGIRPNGHAEGPPGIAVEP